MLENSYLSATKLLERFQIHEDFYTHSCMHAPTGWILHLDCNCRSRLFPSPNMTSSYKGLYCICSDFVSPPYPE